MLSPNSTLLKQSLPIFYEQLISALLLQKKSTPFTIEADKEARAEQDKSVTREAEIHGAELMLLGYTLPHVVYTYGTLCQSIKELAGKKNVHITKNEFNDLNRCLDIAIAGAITGHELTRPSSENTREIERLGYLAHELRNALSSVNLSLQIIKKSSNGFDGTTGQVLGRSLKRIEEIIERSLMEVRLRIDPAIKNESANLLQIIDQIVMTAEIEAKLKNQSLKVMIDPLLVVEADQHLFYSAMSNIIQNAIKYTRPGGMIEIRSNVTEKDIVIEVEDECGGLTKPVEELFKPFGQHHFNRLGIGLGLTIAERAITLNKGTIGVINLPGKGCVFKISMPKKVVGTKVLEDESDPNIIPLHRPDSSDQPSLNQ